MTKSKFELIVFDEFHRFITEAELQSSNTARTAIGLTVTDLCAGAAASVPVHVVQAEDLEGGERRGPRLGGDHSSEASHRPRPHVVVICTN